MIKVVNYGTIRNMQVEFPDRALCAMDIVGSFAKAFVKYMTASGLVSDEVLISSIGTRFCREAMVLGLKDVVARQKDATPEVVRNQQIVIKQCEDDGNWETAIMFARYGHRKDYMEIVGKRLGFTPKQITALKAVEKSA